MWADVSKGDWPGRSDDEIVFEGSPADLVAARNTLTGEHLAR
jgi:hypothetical protein